MRRHGLKFAARWLALLVVLPVTVVVTVDRPYTNSPPIRSDGLGYHAWTRAIVERDFTFCQWTEIVGEKGERARCVNRYPYGLALVRLPVMVPLVDWSKDAPHVSTGEGEANQVAGAVALIVVLAFVTTTLRLLRVEGITVQLALLALVFGTGLFHYATYDASFTHVYTAALVGALVWALTRAKVRSRPTPMIAIALLSFLIVAVRSTSVVLVVAIIVPFTWWAASPDGVSLKARLRRALPWLTPAVAGTLVAVGIEAAYLWYATHRLTFSGYAGEPFLLDRPMQRSVLLSYERGLVTYYPIVAIAVLGPLCHRRTRTAAIAVLGAVAGLTTIYGYWYSWFLGSGFGHRGFVEVVPLMMVTSAFALVALPRLWRGAMLTVGLVLAVATVSLMAGYWQGTFPQGTASADHYWTHVVGEQNLARRWWPG